ncbi:immunity 8 family protein [Pararhizobium sp. BT-229]|uniref:immunity 8 family protein n=1 Tax=Pararhizobium sp. BT-229 TaxID=2986923 RepID=UPI0021F6D3B5|nr:immunity 8 family protein [Pararhizobium sp. BT-229]MCV9963454.1 immunity 8 family protein [Pararhizobium sp. BT-229]
MLAKRRKLAKIASMKNSPFPCRLTLRSCDATNILAGQESVIREGYTLDEIRSGMMTLSAEEILEQWEPADPRSVALFLTLAIGWDNDPGADNFAFRLITNALRDRLGKKLGSDIYVEEFDWPSVRHSILNILRKCERPTWDESLANLRKRFDWEYEGMAGTQSPVE